MTFFLTYSECVFGKNKRLKILYFVNFQPFEMRSEGDSNPRAACDDYTLSRRASSATRASLRLIVYASDCQSNFNTKCLNLPPLAQKQCEDNAFI